MVPQTMEVSLANIIVIHDFLNARATMYAQVTWHLCSGGCFCDINGCCLARLTKSYNTSSKRTVIADWYWVVFATWLFIETLLIESSSAL